MHIFRDGESNGAKLNEEAFEIDRVGLQEMLAHLSSVQVDNVVVPNHKLFMAVRYCKDVDTTRVEKLRL